MERPLKILIAITYYVPHRTGLTLHVQRVAEELARRGHQVTVLTARYTQDLPRDEVGGVRVIRLWAPIKISRGMVMPAYPWATYALLRMHDVVSIHSPLLESALIATLAQMAGRKVVITHHGDLILPRPGGFKSLLNRFIEWGMFQSYRHAAQRAGRIIGYSHDYADNSYYLMPFREKVSIVYPPVPMPEPQPERVAELRAAWQHNGGPIIGYGGRFVEEKRPDLLIRALDVINRQHPDARIVFAGEYDIAYEDFWERSQPIVQKYKEQLIFLGLLTNMQEMANFYAACDVLVLPSATECLGMVQVESMLCGTPAIVSDIPGAREAVRVTGMGRLIMPPGDWRAIGGAVNEVLANPEAYIKAREEIERCYNFKETVDRYERILRANAVKMGRD